MQVNTYTFGSIIIDNKEYQHDVILANNKIKPWHRATSHQVTIADLSPILEENPKLIIFGTGESGVMKVLPATQEYLAKKGVDFKMLLTLEATREFNQQANAAGVVGAFHLTC